MFSTAFLRLSTMLRSSRALSRTIRRHMETAVENHRKLSEVVIPALGIARVQGRTDQVKKSFREAVDLVTKGGELIILDNQQKSEAVELSIEDSVDHLPRLIHRLKKAVAESKCRDDTKLRLTAQLHKFDKELQQMYHQMIEDIKTAYSSAFAETRSSAGGDEHRFLAEKNFASHTILLAEAMKHVYHLRDDAKDVKKDVAQLKEIEQILERELSRMGARQDEIVKLVEKIERETKDMGTRIEQLLEHVRTNFRRFILIMQVFTTYYFVFRKDEKELALYLEEIKKEGFSPQEYEELRTLLSKGDVEVDTVAGDVANVLIRMRHIPQQGEEEANAA